ncbi:hypothetical protein ESP57_00020 [Agromyces fucosus]|uniref:Uncharacterized protein n=1 Tax=Agromyces fucosus TaxID=41985 RepID=A0A4Q2JQD8_9MICO|nr:hypothetical protein [Agromyces fucosus]RXZ50262.1 hypothetical protein ESP57_00020 [Agromyces fucosus]
MSTEPDRSEAAATIPPAADAASSSVSAVLAEVESRPLAERAEAYQTLAGELRTQLEQSDPSLRN